MSPWGRLGRDALCSASSVRKTTWADRIWGRCRSPVSVVRGWVLCRQAGRRVRAKGSRLRATTAQLKERRPCGAQQNPKIRDPDALASAPHVE